MGFACNEIMGLMKPMSNIRKIVNGIFIGLWFVNLLCGWFGLFSSFVFQLDCFSHVLSHLFHIIVRNLLIIQKQWDI